MAATQIKDGFNGGSDNQLKVNADGSINVNSGGGGSSNVNIHDSVGNALNSTAGALDVSIISAGVLISRYAEITSVAIGVETTIISYTVPTTIASLKNVQASGQNIGEIHVYLNGTIIDKQYLYYTGFNLFFDFESLPIVNGDVVAVKALNNGQDVCNFNAKIQVLEDA